MYREYSKIFFSRNLPKSFNYSLIFPFFATLISSVAVIIIYSAMQSLENQVTSKIIGITGHSRIYFDSKTDEDFNLKYLEIKNYLSKNDKNISKSIEGRGIITYSNQNVSSEEVTKIVKVVGVSDISALFEKLNINYKNYGDLENKILIGKELAEYLEINYIQNNRVSIFAPLDSKIFLQFSSFEVLDENFNILDINATDKISENYVFIDYEEAKAIFSESKSYISVDNTLEDQEIKYIDSFVNNIKYREWGSFYPNLFESMRIEKFLYTSFGLILIFVASFNLYGLVNLIIYRKKNQLAILLYQGADLKQIKMIFTGNILILGALASLFGIIVSYFVSASDYMLELLPMLNKIEISLSIVSFSFIFNLIALYLSCHISIRKNIQNIEDLKSNAIES